MSKKIVYSSIQLGIAIVLIPVIFILLGIICPDEFRKTAWNSVQAFMDNVPLVGSIFNLVDGFKSMPQTTEGFLEFFNDMNHRIGDCIIDATIIGMIIHALRELCIIFIPGIQALAVVVGSVAGVFAVKLSAGFSFHARFTIAIALIVANVLLIFLTEPGTNPRSRNKKIADTVLLGFQAIIAGFSLFFAACVFWLFVYKPTSVYDIMTKWFVPAALLTVMMVVDYLGLTEDWH